MRMHRLLLLALVLLAVACTTDGGSDASSTSVGESPSTSGGDTTEPTQTTAPQTTTTSSTLPPGTEELPEELRADMAELIAVTEEVRRLEFLEQPLITVVSDEELAERVRDQLAEDLEDVPADEALYELLGLIDEDTDLVQLYTDLYSEQVAGFYDGETGELVVPVAEDGFTPVQRATLVHELAHSLTDQHYGFHDRYVELLDGDRFDEASAYQAVIEGDATLAELLYLQGLSAEEQSEFFSEALDVETASFDEAPPFIRNALIFPYETGFMFVDRLFGTGGFEAIADAYQDPPTSTEQIIDPDDFPADGPIDVTLPEISIDGFDLAYGSTWGELGFRLMFDQELEDEARLQAAAQGWGGDAYQLLFDGEEAVLVLRYVGDAVVDAEELGAALVEYGTAAMAVDPESEAELEGGTALSGEDHLWVAVDEATVSLVAAGNEAAFEEAVSALAADVGDGADGE